MVGGAFQYGHLAVAADTLATGVVDLDTGALQRVQNGLSGADLHLPTAARENDHVTAGAGRLLRGLEAFGVDMADWAPCTRTL